MNFIKTRLTVLIVLAVTMVVTFGILAHRAQRQLSTDNLALRDSYALVEEALRLAQEKFDAKVLERLQTVRGQLTPAHRMEAFSDILQSYAAKNPKILKQRVELFEKNEREYRKYLGPRIAYAERQMFYYGAVSVITCLLTLLVLYVYTLRAVLRPVKDLTANMVDFLDQRYTYQFSVPAPNEVGNLQATFNSLAQRVLANMEELKSLDRAKSEFLSIASHELRTPLTSIKGSLSLLNSGVMGKFPESLMGLVTIAENETDRLIRLINDLLDLAKIEARRLPLAKAWRPLEHVVDDTLQGLQGFARAAKVTLVTAGDFSFDVHVDKDRIQQVLTNLLSNAIKYSPERGSVTVRCQVDERNQLCLEVIDQGKGIAPEDQELIFESFRQATGPDNPLVKGTGLGLTIAKALVEEHNGKIGVKSKPGEGSTFYFTLPEWRPAQMSREREQSADDSVESGAA